MIGNILVRGNLLYHIIDLKLWYPFGTFTLRKTEELVITKMIRDKLSD